MNRWPLAQLIPKGRTETLWIHYQAFTVLYYPPNPR